MGSVLVANSLLGTDGNPIVSLVDQQIEAIKALIGTYIAGAGEVFKGVRPPGDESFPVPCVQLQAQVVRPKMYALGKWLTHTEVMVVYFTADDNADNCDQKASDLAIIFRKLFSQNALNDITGAATTQFKRYVTTPAGQSGWIDSEMTEIQKGPLMKWTIDNAGKYVCVSFFKLKLESTEVI